MKKCMHDIHAALQAQGEENRSSRGEAKINQSRGEAKIKQPQQERPDLFKIHLTACPERIPIFLATQTTTI